jgi:hypothetical protein
MTQPIKIASPKPILRIRIPEPLSDEEILKSPIDSPAAPQVVSLHPFIKFLKKRMRFL